MQVGDLVKHEYWGLGIITGQQGVVDRWFVRWLGRGGLFKATAFAAHSVWGSDLEVLSESA